MYLVPRWILSGFPTCSTHDMLPLVETRTLLEREVPSNKLEGLVPRNLLPGCYKTSDVVGVYMVALVVGNGVQSGRCVEVEKRGIVRFLVKRFARKS